MSDAAVAAENPMTFKQRSMVIGSIVWLGFILLARPSPFDVQWAHALLLFAALVLVPLAIGMLECASDRWWQFVRLLQLPSALALGYAFLQPSGIVAGAFAAPWLVLTVLVGLGGVRCAQRNRGKPVSELCIAAGLVFLPIGSGWAVLDRLGIRPLDFDEVIVLLTAIHFHYAGFVLPIVAGLLARHIDGKFSRVAAVGVILTVPLVAAGITLTQVGFTPLWETVAAWFLAACGMAVGWQHLWLAQQRHWLPLTRACWRVAGASLIASMVLAAMYGTRHFAPLEWLDIPWMRALHGTANAFGFGLVGLIGWWRTCRTDAPPQPLGRSSTVV